MSASQSFQTTPNRRGVSESLGPERTPLRRRRPGAMDPPSSHPRATPGTRNRDRMSEPREDAFGRTVWKPIPPQKNPHWDKDAVVGEPRGLSSWSIVLSFFEDNPGAWARTRQGASGTAADRVAGEIHRYMYDHDAPWQRKPEQIKKRVFHVYNDRYSYVRQHLDGSTGFGEGREYTTWKRGKRMCRVYEDELNYNCPQYHRCVAVFGEAAAHRFEETSGPINRQQAADELSIDICRRIGRANARNNDILEDLSDENLEDPDIEARADDVDEDELETDDAGEASQRASSTAQRGRGMSRAGSQARRASRSASASSRRSYTTSINEEWIEKMSSMQTDSSQKTEAYQTRRLQLEEARARREDARYRRDRGMKELDLYMQIRRDRPDISSEEAQAEARMLIRRYMASPSPSSP